MDSAKITVQSPVTYQGTKMKVLSIPGEVLTTTATTAVIASYTMTDETCCSFDFVAVVRGVGAGSFPNGRWDGKATYKREGGGGPTAIGGGAEYGTAQTQIAADTVTFDISGNIVRVLASAADADDRNWSCELRVHEVLGT